jgi:hypothetical protein
VKVGSGVAVGSRIVAVKEGAGDPVGKLLAPAPQEDRINDTNITIK